jgi:prolyl-tRNA editing enzyme YbaK/EbsC (Cys-tRNA(Pro) deacylase)
MSLESVRTFLATHAPDIEILLHDGETATVAQAAAAHGVPEAAIAKTLSLAVGGQPFLLVTAGTARLDNRRAKDQFGGKVSMLGPEEVLRLTGHPVGGVCPFGLATTLPVYCDMSLKAFVEVVPAAGSRTSALRIAPEKLATLTGAKWVDVCSNAAATATGSAP